MRQAIEEGFIVDVLQNYTTYKTYFQISKAIADVNVLYLLAVNYTTHTSDALLTK